MHTRKYHPLDPRISSTINGTSSFRFTFGAVMGVVTALSIVAVLGAALLLMASAVAGAEERKGFYIAGWGAYLAQEDADFQLGATAFSSDSRDGYRFGGAVGYSFNNWLRAELEGAYAHNTIQPVGISTDLKQATAMVNGYVDIDVGLALVPYLGLGIGMTAQSEDLLNSDSFVPTAQGIVGVTFELNDTFDIFTEYRYVRSVDSNLGGLVEVDGGIANHTIGAGLRLHF